ncbi:transient receptor potential cation channel subfamily M member 1 [Patella vulgata]|uniref:transient receptor potential cation channel subfamily M member 1 n=1 Tax=Patella vulgata TaxID=6465 RepID=UPI0024A9F7A6|nr:transient receptor potential cation channel subfamily M member 1 [Patella vulgata]
MSRKKSKNNDDDDVFEMGPGAMDLVERQQSPSSIPTFSFTNTSDEDEETPSVEGKKVSFPAGTMDYNSGGLKLDPKYSTIQSSDSAVSRESSTAMFGPYDMWSSGIIQFLMLGGDVNDKDRYYVCVPKEASVDNIADFIAYRWKKRSPKVVLSLITNTKYFKAWKNEVQVEDFQRGIIEAANLTEMWVLTDGLDSGMSKLIGNAVAEELARRSSLELDNLHIENTWVREKLPKLTVIGVVSKSEISYGSYLDGKHNEPKSVENVGQKPHLDRFELNPDHTHFILAEDMSKQEMINLRFNLEQRFIHSVGRPRRYRRMPSSHTTIPGSDPAVIFDQILIL